MGRWIEAAILWLIVIALWCASAVLAIATLIYAVSNETQPTLYCFMGAYFCGALAHNMRRDHL